MNNCGYCENNLPHLHYYLTKHSPKFNSFEDAYENTKQHMISYHNEYGKYGFLSEHTDEEYLSENNILSRSKSIWEADQISVYDANKSACTNIKELEYLKDSSDFVRFL